MVIDNQLETIFARLRKTADFAETDFSDVSATSTDGDNALRREMGRSRRC
jgi:hypothetical protein